MAEDERTPVFQERPTARIAPEGWPFIAVALALTAAAFGFGAPVLAAGLGAVAGSNARYGPHPRACS